MPESEVVTILCYSQDIRDIVEGAVRVLNESQNQFDFQVVSPRLPLPPPDLGMVYSWRLLTSLLEHEKQCFRAKYLFAILSERIEHNWFSRTIHDRRVCFITIKDWEYLSHLPVIAFVAYEIVENLVEMLIGEAPFHEETRGCLHDLCAIKPHISFKIRTADVCTECMDRLRARLSPSELESVIAMLEEVRRVALGRRVYARTQESLSDAEKIDREFPFPVAYCFRSMQAEITYSRKWLKLFELYEVVIKYVTFLLLSDLRQNADTTPEDLRECLARLVRASAGQWHTTCFRVVRYLTNHPDHPWFTEQWLATLTNRCIQEAHSASQELVHLRNQTTGHGFVEEENRYRELYEEHVGKVQTLLRFVAPLSTNYTLLKVGELRRRGGISTFPAKILKGSHPLFPVERRQSTQEVDTDCLLHNPVTDSYLSLYPWIILDYCPQCYREMVFLYDKIEGEQVVMREYPTNHVRNYSELLEHLRDLIPGSL